MSGHLTLSKSSLKVMTQTLKKQINFLRTLWTRKSALIHLSAAQQSPKTLLASSWTSSAFQLITWSLECSTLQCQTQNKSANNSFSLLWTPSKTLINCHKWHLCGIKTVRQGLSKSKLKSTQLKTLLPCYHSPRTTLVSVCSKILQTKYFWRVTSDCKKARSKRTILYKKNPASVLPLHPVSCSFLSPSHCE